MTDNKLYIEPDKSEGHVLLGRVPEHFTFYDVEGGIKKVSEKVDEVNRNVLEIPSKIVPVPANGNELFVNHRHAMIYFNATLALPFKGDKMVRFKQTIDHTDWSWTTEEGKRYEELMKNEFEANTVIEVCRLERITPGTRLYVDKDFCECYDRFENWYATELMVRTHKILKISNVQYATSCQSTDISSHPLAELEREVPADILLKWLYNV